MKRSVDSVLADWFALKQVRSREIDLRRERRADHVDEILRDYRSCMSSQASSVRKAIQRLKASCPMDPVVFGGDGLHLSTSYAEPHVSDWLSWILQARPLGSKHRLKVVNGFFKALADFHGLTAPPRLREPYEVKREYSVNMRPYPVEQKRGAIDLVLSSGTENIAIENKIGDKNFQKNVYYKRELEKEGKPLFTVMFLPEEDFEELQRDTEEEDSTPNDLEIHAAFPPVPWTIVTRKLTDALLEVWSSNDDGRWAWASQTAAFISFIESHINTSGVKAAHKLLTESTTNNSHLINRALSYLRGRGIEVK